MTSADKELFFAVLGLPLLVLFIRFFFVGAIGWFGTALAYPFYLTRHIWVFIGYVLANAWLLSAKIFGIMLIVIPVSLYFGYKQPMDWAFYTLMYVFYWWPLWVLEHVLKVFA